jgi:sporulation protein YlmC with PRC-barrel domain
VHIELGELRQRAVVDAAGRVVGEVDEIAIDTSSWRVMTLRVKLRRAAGAAMGAEQSIFRAGHIEVPSEMVQSVGDAVVLRVDARELVPNADEEVDVAAPR